MKIKKTLFSTEIEITPTELRDFVESSRSTSFGNIEWLEKMIGWKFIAPQEGK